MACTTGPAALGVDIVEWEGSVRVDLKVSD